MRLIKIGSNAKTFTPGEIVSAMGHPSRAPGSGRSGGAAPGPGGGV